MAVMLGTMLLLREIGLWFGDDLVDWYLDTFTG